MPVLLDTGSTGLHIVSSALGNSQLNVTTTNSTESYADGTQYTGVLASAPVNFGSSGGVATSGPISFQSITSVGCVSSKPECPAAGGASELIQRGLYGTMGVSLSPSAGVNAPLYSPLLQIPGGSTGFSIAYQSTAAGTITVGAETGRSLGGVTLPLTAASPSTYANGSGAWNVASGQACWTVSGSGPVCGATTFDSGTPATGVEASDFPGLDVSGQNFPAGASVTVSATKGGTPFWSFTSGTTENSNVVTTTAPAASLVATTGNPFFYSGAVTYDSGIGQIIVYTNPS